MGTGYWVLDTGYWVQGTGYRVLSTGYWVQGVGYRVQGTGYWVPKSGTSENVTIAKKEQSLHFSYVLFAVPTKNVTLFMIVTFFAVSHLTSNVLIEYI